MSTASILFLLPYGYSLHGYVLFDAGWALSTDALLVEGLIPTKDFAYFYGLLVLSVDRVWFSIFGSTPEAQLGMWWLCAFATVTGVVRFAVAVRLRLPARIFLLTALPTLIVPGIYTPAHVLEPALLANALAFQARGKFAPALMLTTVSLFVKASMAGLYGLVLLCIILFAPVAGGGGLIRRLRELLPAAAVGLALAGLLAAQYGIQPLLDTLFPTAGAAVYQSEKYGFFFGVGRRWYRPDELHWWYYIFTQITVWMVGTAVLVAGAVRAACFGHGPGSAVIATLGLIHVLFIFLLFGNEFSWKYYCYMLMCGVSGVIDRVGLPHRSGAPSWWLAGGVTVLAFLGQTLELVVVLGIWLTATSSPVTNGLMSDRADHDLWRWVRTTSASEPVLVFAPVSAAHNIFPELDSPRSWFLLRPIATKSEVESLRQQIRHAKWIVTIRNEWLREPTVPPATKTPPLHHIKLAEWEELREECRKFQEDRERSTRALVVLRRIALPPPDH